MRLFRKSAYARYDAMLRDAPFLQSPANAAKLEQHLHRTMQLAQMNRTLTPEEVHRLKQGADGVWTHRHTNMQRRRERSPTLPGRPPSPSPRNAQVDRLVRQAATSVARNRAGKQARNRELAALMQRFQALKRR